jgi:predicted nucleic acid-binding protein
MILIDTTPLVALCDARDSRHGRAMAHLDALAPAGLGVCEAVVTEACFHLPHRSQRQRLRAVLGELDVTPLPGANEWDFWVEVFEWLEKYADHEPDWADGCIAVLCGRDARLKVWTYDREFRTIWRRPDGTPIPLAVKS